MSKRVKSIDKQTGLVFDKRQTNIAKGIALLLLLWHHLFYDTPEKYKMFTSIFVFNGVPIECIFARFCKACVAIFLFLSGYGLTKSFSKYFAQNSINGKLPIKNNFRYVFNHLIGLLSDYWLIFVIFVPMGLLFGKSFITYYGFNPLYYLSDFFGVSYLFFGYNATMNVTWWFMSVILVFYLAFPLLHKLLRYSSELLLLISIFLLFCPFIPDFRQLKLWLCPFVFGMYISNYNGLDKIRRIVNTNTKAILCSFFAISITAYLRISFFEDKATIDFLFAFAIIVFSFLILSKIPILNSVLEHLGKYSGMIFMFHTFIYSNYFHNFIYCFKFSPLIYIVMLIVCYLIAKGLELLKKLIKYDSLIKRIII